MVVNPLKVFLFLAGGTVAAGATAYVSGALDPYIHDLKAAAVADVPAPAPTDPAAPKGERLPGEEPPATMAAEPPATMAAEPPAAEAPPATTIEPPATMAAVTPPADDVAAPPTMAAEPPATMAAEPPADSGKTPPADAATPPAGPAVPTFDVVRVEADGSVVIAGKAESDALVELLSGATVLASTKASPEGDFAIVLDEPLKPGDYQITLRATLPDGAVVASLETAVLSIPETPGGQVLAMVEQPGEASEILTAPQPEAPAAPAPAEPKVEEVAVPPADAAVPKVDEAAAPPATTEPQPPAVAAVTPPAEQPAPAEVKVTVEAVEIEGSKIFVAGSSEPGRMIRAYANEIVLGETKVSKGGRFLVEAERDLPVGNYIIRADVLDSDGVKVIARAAVPFEREPGEDIAAVAPPADAAAEPPATVAAAEPARPATETPPVVAAAEPAAPATETPPAVAAAEPAAPATETPPAVAAAEPAAPATDAPPTVAAAEPAAPATDTPPAVAAAEPAAPATDTPPAAAAVEPAAPATEAPPAVDVAAAPPPETTAPKLQKVQGAVIIRRGDSLWRISRRVYGHGMRYSTIYLANQEQIRDPDRIWPGQVFRMPDKTKEGEAADMTAIGDQATTTPTTE